MRSIAILNQKGGVGKTTTAVNTVAALARSGHRVLLIDLDPQCHATLHLGLELIDGDRSVYELLTSDVPIADVARSVDDNLIVIPASLDLVGAELELAETADRETALARVLSTYQQSFDFCIVDCAPSLGLLTINALAAVNEVIIPLQPHFLALQGLGRLLETVTLVRGVLNPPLHISGIVLCMYESGTRLAQEVHRDVTEFIAAAGPDDPWRNARVFSTVIRRNIKLAECPSFGQSVLDYAPSSNGAIDYLALAQELAGDPAPQESVTAAAAQPVEDVAPSNPADFAPDATPEPASPVERPVES